MADHPRADLDQLLAERGQRPVHHRSWQRHRAHEVGEIVGERVKLKPNLVVVQLQAGEVCLIKGVLAFFNTLLYFIVQIIEGHQPIGGVGQVGDEEADGGDRVAWMPFNLGDHAARAVPTLGRIVEAEVIVPGVLRPASCSSFQPDS